MKNISMLTSAVLLGLSSSSILAQDLEPSGYTDAGIPLLQTNPGAPIAIYLDFDGGVYSYDGEVLSPYNRGTDEGSDGNPLTFDAAEQADIINSVANIDEYFSMFDVNVTTDFSVMENANAAAWVIITEDKAGGKGYVGGSGIAPNQPYAKAFSAAARSRIESDNKNRTIASELGHNFGLMHQGVCTDGDFSKLNIAPTFDGQRGAVMGSGEGIVNSWRYGQSDRKNGCAELQDDLALIHKRILEVVPADYVGDGYRKDDYSQLHDETATELFVNDDNQWTITGNIERESDKDTFSINWNGGDFHLVATPKGVSAVDVIVRVFDHNSTLVREINSDNINIEYLAIPSLVQGQYYIEVMSHGAYGELGAYNLLIQDESAGPPQSGRLEIAINASSDDAEENAEGAITRSSTDLELITDQSNQIIGLRFTGINIPNQTQINNAYIQFQSDETDHEDTDLEIFAELNTSPFTFKSSTGNISSRQKTTASVQWQPSPWVFKGERTDAQKTSNLKAVVQEVINLNTWVPGDDLAFIITGIGKRVAESFDGSVEGAPTLIIEYGDYDSTIVIPDEPDGEEDDVVIENPIDETPTYTVVTPIIRGSGDVEEHATGSVSTSSSDLELVQDSDIQKVGLRFENLNLPKDAIITNAYVQFTAHSSSNEITNLVIATESIGQPSDFKGSDFNVSDRMLNHEKVLWSPDPWYFKGDADLAQRTPNLAEIIQPVVSHTDWNVGNSLAVIISGEGKRTATSFDSDPELAPQLVVTYQLPEVEPYQTISHSIASGEDDAEEYATGKVDTHSSDLEMVVDGDAQVVGLRFTGVDLPVNAQIIDARIQFQSDETDFETTQLVFAAELESNSLPFTNEVFNLTHRTLTNAQLVWDVNYWRDVHKSGAAQLTPNLLSILNEVTTQTNWQAGNAITFIITGEGKRVATSYDNNPTAAAKLIIKYRL